MSALPQDYLDATRTATPRPSTWEGVVGNTYAVSIIRESIAAARIDERAAPHMLLFGPPGMGKSTMAKLAARENGSGYIETTASNFETQADVLRVLYEMNELREDTGRPVTLFIDEIHRIGDSRGRQSIDVESIYSLLEDWRFPHNMTGKKIPLDGEVEITPTTPIFNVWPFTAIGGTTEPGMLPQPLLRRFLVHVELEPYTEEDIAKILRGSAERMEWSMEAGAEAGLARVSRRSPGLSYQLLTRAHSRAVARFGKGRPITQDIVAGLIEDMRLYPMGLGEKDVRVLRMLADRPKGMGMGELSKAVGIAQSQFTDMIEPYLRLLGFIETLNRRVITPLGLAYLGQIGGVDVTRPEIRAAMEKYGNQLEVR